MPKAPPETEPSKVNPYITKAISKSLLTPCRQVGLSRKKKTPNSASSSFSESTFSPVTDTTPVSSVQPLNDTSESKPHSKKSQKTQHKKQNRVKKRLIADESDEDSDLDCVNKKLCSELRNEELTAAVDNTAVPKESPSKKLKCEKVQDDLDNIELSSNEVETGSKSKTRLKKSPRKSKESSAGNVKEDTGGSKVDCKNRDVEIKSTNETCDSSHEDNVTEKEAMHNDTRNKRNRNESKQKQNLNREKKKECDATLKKAGNLEKEKKVLKPNTNKLESDEHKMIKSKDNREEMLHNNSEAIILKDVTNKEEQSKTLKEEFRSKNSSTEPDKTKKMKRSLSMKRSSSDDKDHKFDEVGLTECSIILSPVDTSGNVDPTLLSNEIKNLQKQVKEKHKLIDELKQAEIYKKKHNVKELEELTAQWKRGCISALNDLLVQLQKHTAIDMATLLKNLGIPSEKITISPNGDLI